VTLNAIGVMTLGDGTAIPENLTAKGASATVILNATISPMTNAAVTENINSVLTASSLLLLGTAAFTLNQFNSVGTLAANVAGDVLFQNSAALVLGASVVSGNLGATTTNGSITQITNTTLSVGNNLTLRTTGNNDLTIGSAVAGGSVTISSGGKLTVGTISSASTGNITLTSGGTQTDDLVIGSAVAAGNVTISSGAKLTVGTISTTSNGDIALTSGDMQTDDLAIGSAVAAGNVTISSGAKLSAGTISTTSNGDIALTSGDMQTVTANVSAGMGTITWNPSAGGVTQTGGALTALNLLLLGSGPFMLNQSGNDVDTLAASVTGSISYQDSDALTVGSVNDMNNIPTNGITTNGGDVTLSNLAGTLTLDDPVNANKPVPPGGGGTVRLSSAGALTQIAAAAITANGGIYLTSDTSLAGGNTMTLAANVNAGTGTVELNASAGGVSQTAGGVNQTGGALTALNLVLLGKGIFSLNQPLNDVAILAADVTGPLSYQDKNALTVGSVMDINNITTSGITTHGNNLILQSGGALTVGNISDGNGTDRITTQGGDVTLCNRAGDLTLNDPVNAGGGNVRLSSAGAVTQIAAAAITAANLGVLASLGAPLVTGDIALDKAANSVTGIFAANNNGAGKVIDFQDSLGFTVGVVPSPFMGSCFTGATGATTSNGNITLTSGGNMTVAANVTSNGGAITLSSSGSLTLGDGTNTPENVTASGATITLDATVSPVTNPAVT
jgi:hypothetical protein